MGARAAAAALSGCSGTQKAVERRFENAETQRRKGRRGKPAALCAYELRQSLILFHDAALYGLVTGGLLFALKILKGA